MTTRASSNQRSIVHLLLLGGLLVSAFGCNGIAKLNCLGQKPLPPSVAHVNVWLQGNVDVPIPKEGGVLQEILLDQRVAGQRSILDTLGEEVDASDTATVTGKIFRDNCVVLFRDKETWYFLEPMELVRQGIPVPVRPEQKLATIPIDQSRFVAESVADKSEIIWIEPDGTSSRRTIEGNLLIGYFVRQQRDRGELDVLVISRLVGARYHHLVVPLLKDNQSKIGRAHV